MLQLQMWDEVQLLCGGPVMTVYGLGDKRVHVAFVFEGRAVKCWIDRRVFKICREVAHLPIPPKRTG